MGKLMIRNSDDSAWITIAGVGTVVQQDAEPGTPHAGMMWLDTDATSGLQSEIRDTDGDTKIQCEESADEDIIRFDVGGSEAMVISSAGEVTKPLQPAFEARGLTAAMVDMAITTYHTIKFDQTLDQNNDYDNATWTFTAPVDGWYVFSYSYLITGWDVTAGQTYFQLFTSNGTFGYLDSNAHFEASAYYAYAKATVVAYMDANDTAYVHYYVSAGAGTCDVLDNNSYTYFTGYLLG